MKNEIKEILHKGFDGFIAGTEDIAAKEWDNLIDAVANAVLAKIKEKKG